MEFLCLWGVVIGMTVKHISILTYGGDKSLQSIKKKLLTLLLLLFIYLFIYLLFIYFYLFIIYLLFIYLFINIIIYFLFIIYLPKCKLHSLLLINSNVNKAKQSKQEKKKLFLNFFNSHK